MREPLRETDPAAWAARWALGVLATCTLLNLLGRGLTDTYAVFLLPLAREFGADRAALTGVYSTFMVAQGIASPLVGALFDRVGPRAVYGVGMGCLGAGYFLAGSADALWQLHALIGVCGGIGAASLGMIPASALANRWFDRHLPRSMAVLYAALGVGVLVLAPLSQWLIEMNGWRSAYRVLGAGALLATPIVLLLPWTTIARGRPGYADQARRRVAREGSWTLARALRAGPFWALSGILFMTSVTTFSISVQVVAYLVEIGYPPLQAASVYGMAGSLSVVGIVGAGVLAERYGEHRVAIAAYTSTFLGIVALALVESFPGYLLLAAYVVLCGTVSGSRGPLIATLAARYFGGAGLGTIYGGITVSMGLGAALGSWATGLLHDLTHGYRAGFALAAFAAIGGAVLFRALGRGDPGGGAAGRSGG